ncbi:MAG: NTF2-like N-terminal transpeptidase domain-containing protein, partial [Solirubrobacteraceae bacterium]
MNTSNEHRRRIRRATPVIALAAVAFIVGAIFGSGHHSSPQQSLAEQFATAWARKDYATMYGDIDEASQRRISPSAFAAAYQAATLTATETSIEVVGRARGESDGAISVPMRVSTRLWGALTESLRLRVSNSSAGPRVMWSHALVFP